MGEKLGKVEALEGVSRGEEEGRGGTDEEEGSAGEGGGGVGGEGEEVGEWRGGECLFV